jgi:ABC-type transport system involved in multi-copper enzyme maturation permease subunit
MMVSRLRAEWTKLRTVRSTVWTLLLAFALSTGLAYLIGRVFRADAGNQPGFDPLFATFYSLTIGQLAVVTFAVFAVSAEYSSGTIRWALRAVPRRAAFFGTQIATVALVLAAASSVVVLSTFAAAQAGLGARHTGLAAPGAGQATVGAWLYLTLIGLFAAGLATFLRNAAVSLGVLLPLLFLGSQGLGNIPKVKTVTQFLPDQGGWVIMHLAGPAGDPRWARVYGPWSGMALVAAWTAAALLAGYLALRRRDVRG